MAKRLPNGHWVPGQSGNPSGRPTNKLRKLLKQYLDQPHDDGRDRAQMLVEEAFRLAIDPTEKGRDKLAAIAWIVDQVDGKLPTKLMGEGEQGGGIIIRFTDAEPPASN